jgi:hypothetical protein
MVHKKYIKRGGKTFGPYLYENYRENGVTKTRYLGLAKEEKKLRVNKNFIVVAGALFLILSFVFLFSFYSSGITGKVTSEITSISQNITGESTTSEITPPENTNPEIVEPIVEENKSNVTLFENNQTVNITENVTEKIVEETNQTVEQNITEEVNGTTEQNTTQETVEQIVEENKTVVEEINVTIVENKTIENETDSEIVTKQYKAVIGKPVKWIKMTNSFENLTIELPKEAENISIKTGDEVKEALKEAESEKAVGISMTGAVIGSNNNFIMNFFNWIRGFTITGKVISEEDIKIIENENSKTVDLENVAKPNEEVAVEYYTEAPESSETNIGNGKKIVVSASDELGYTDILAYTNLSKEVSADKIKFYHLINGSREEIKLEKYDLNGNGLIDYVEWNVPHLSEQTYELIIEISNAEHLDVNKEFISDIYNSVKSKDNFWSEKINNGEYVRITFKQKLTKTNDITIYARGNSTIEVYEKGGNDLIATFPSVNEENYYKVYLNNLLDSQDSFDLKILGNAEFDYIVDPISNIQFVSPTPSNGKILSLELMSLQSAYINVSTTDTSSHFTFLNWNKSIVGWWRMDDTNSSGDIVDYFGVLNGTKLANTTQVTDGKFGKGLLINGTSSGIKLPGTLLNFTNSNFSISAWVSFNDTTARQTLVMSGAVDSPSSTQYALYLNFGTLQLQVSNGATTLTSVGSSPSSSNVWYHVVGVWNQTTISLYVNGTLVDSDTNSSLGSLKDNEGIAGIGGDQAFNRYYLNGSIDEVIIFKRVLSSSEILSLYNASVNQYYNNFTGLGNGIYTYRAYASDLAGNVNSTEEQSVTVTSSVAPDINFTNPTPSNGQILNRDFGANIYVNVSTTDESNHSAWIDFNRNLIGWWSMDSYNSTGIYDNSTWGNHGTFQGGLSSNNITPGIRGNALQFDGINDYVTIGNGTKFSDLCNNGCTITAWIKSGSTGVNNEIVGRSSTSENGIANRYFELALASNNRIQSTIYPNGVDDGFTCSVASEFGFDTPPGTWFFVALRYNQTGLLSAINDHYGGVTSCSVINQTAWNSSYNTLIGAGGTGSNLVYNGSIDEVTLWNRDLSIAELSALYNAKTYPLYHNFTNLVDGNYSLRAFTIDAFGSVNLTEQRNISIYTIVPVLNFTYPTPVNYFQGVSNFLINVSLTDSYLSNITYNWDGTNYYFGLSNSIINYRSYSQDFESATFPPTGWTTGGDANWYRNTTEPLFGTASAASGDIGDSQKTWMNFTQDFSNPGNVSFFWNVSSEAGYDFACFCVDKACGDTGCSCSTALGTADVRLSSSIDGVWTSENVSYYINTSGRHMLTWCYSKDLVNSSGADMAKVDNIAISNQNINLTFTLTNLTNGLWNILINQSTLINSTSYTYYVKATDLYGNSNQTETRTIRGPNSAPSTTTPVLFPTSLDRTSNLTCNFTITDLDAAAIWDTDVKLSTETISSKMDCDTTYCYGIDASGYFLKVDKTNGTQIFNRTNGNSRRVTTSGTRGFSCDVNFCYAEDWDGNDGWFLKINKTNGTIIYNKTIGGFGILTSDQIYSMYCNSTDYCYGGDSLGFVIKVNKSSGEHIWNTTAGYTMQKSSYTIYGLSCDSDFCYAADGGGYFTKFNKTSGTTNWSNQLTTTAIYGFYCDSDYCYGGDSTGFLLKAYKNGTQIWNLISGSQIRPSTSAVYGLSCDSDYCYGADSEGYLLKVNNTNNVPSVQYLWNKTTGYIVKPTTNAVYGLSCDNVYCYGGNNGYFIKFRKAGDILLANVTWYKNDTFNQSYILDAINGTMLSTVLYYKNLTKYDNWTCSVTPYDKIAYGANVNSSTITISDAIPNITFVQINPPAYLNTPVSANAYYYDSDADSGTLNFTWYVNGVSVENDTLINVQSGTFVTTYLNATKNAGDIITIRVFANDSVYNSSLISWNRLTWNSTIRLSSSTGGIYSGIYCDNYYCYSGDASGYFLKVSKTNGTQIFNLSTGYTNKPGNVLMTSPIFCDNNFCYQGDQNGYFIKLNKNSGVHTYNTTSGYTNRPTTTQIDSLYCDSDFCYGGDGSGFFLKINKTSGVHIFNTTSGYTNQPTTNLIYGLSCDNNFCYGVDAGGYFLKINKTSGVHIYNITSGYTNKPSISPIYALYCNSEFCYAGDSDGFFLKINKTSGVHLYNRTLGYTARPTINSITSISCDHYSCYAGDNAGNLLKINKTSGALISTIKISSNTLSLGIFCDADYCYAGDSQGYIIKVFETNSVTVENYPEIYFASATTTASGNYSQSFITTNTTINSNIRMSTIQISVYNSTGLVNSSSTTDTSVSSFYTNFSSMQDGIYSLNATLNNTDGDFNFTETRTIILDTTPPVITITSPDNTSITYSAIIEFNATVSDALQTVSSCQFSLDGAPNVTMSLNVSKTFANYTYLGITHGYHNLTISCNDTLGNMGSATETNFQVTLLDLSIANVTLPTPTFSNSTLITINVSNQGPPIASNVNVSCYFNGIIFESKVISSIAGGSSYITNCTRTFIPANNQNLTIAVDPMNSIAENNETNNNYTIVLNITQIANITINTASIANTTDTINVKGQIIGNNGTALINKRFMIKLNNIVVSSNTLNFSNFATGNASEVNISNNILRLNLSNEGNLNSYSDLYTTNSYTTDSHVVAYNSEGFYAPSGILFHLSDMPFDVGNITYLFNATTKFYNATAYIETYSSASPPGANTSLLYSFNNITWNTLASTTASSTIIGGAIPGINGQTTIYLMIRSDTFGGTKENPVTRFEFNYTNYNYSAIGSLISSSINLPNITYTVLKWDQQLNGGEIKLQLRESDDNLNWGAWGNNYTSNLENDISAFTKPYVQYRAWLSTTNQSLTPILYSVNISYFNASTNSTGGYNYNVTIPTTSIGILPLEVSISQTPDNEGNTGISGANSTNIAIWARTTLPYSVIKNYSGESNYSVNVNFTRSDTNGLVNGTINVSIYNSTMMLSQTCYASTCSASWLIPSELSYGNYTINITGYNETAYYINASTISFADYLEEKNTTGTLFVPDKTISDYNPSLNYYFYLNATINNTGKASMNNPHVWSSSLQSGTGFANVSEITPCPTILPNTSCNALILVTVKSGLGQRTDSVTWRANWTDNDGSIAGGLGHIDYTSSITILSNAILNISNSSVRKTIQHAASDSFVFDVESTGTSDVVNINITFNDGDLASWITITPNWIAGLVGGQTSTVNVSINVPVQTTPGNYSGIINVSSTNAGEKYLTLNITVPQNLSWYFVPTTNFTYNNSFSLNTPGEVANYTIVNTGNVNLTMNISYIPGGTTCSGSPYDYSCQGTTIFSPDYLTYNPTQVNVTKGENATFTVYQKGFTTTLNDVRVIVKFFNESASPTTNSVEDTFYIYQRPPNVTNVWFYLDGIAGNKSEVNKNLTIKVRATDDVNINETAMKINVTYGSTTITLNATSLCGSFGECVGASGSRTVANFTANFTPITTGLHSVKVIVFNTEAVPQTHISGTYNFSSYGTTTVNISKNISSVTTRTVDKNNKYTFYVNYTINNTGMVYAYNPFLNFTLNSSIVTGPTNYTFNNLSSGTNLTKVFQINVSALTPPGTYNVTATINWLNPDTSSNSVSTIFNITILSNKSFDYSPASLDYTLNSGGQNSSLLIINNTGNDLLSSMNLVCYTATLCPVFTISYNESNFNIERNNSRYINISLTAPAGLAAGIYTGGLNITEQNISKLISISATVPENRSWILSPTALNITRGVSSAGDLQLVTINNTGNVNLTFEINSSNSSIIGSNVSEIMVPLGSSAYFMLNYSAPSTEGSFVIVINVTNSSASPTLNNITINLTTTQTNVTILSPTTASPVTNVTSGENISILANVTYLGTPLTDNITWAVTIGGSSCTNLSAISISNLWNVTCAAPNITDGLTYDLTATMTHTTFGTISTTETNAVVYKDVTPPSFNITRNNINKDNNLNIQVNVTDNAAVSYVSAVLIYPNSSQFSLSLTLNAGLYINNSINLTTPGEYLVNFTANDTTGNINSTTDWFEVYDNYFWNVNFLDFNSQAVPDVNITLYRPNTTTILANGTTNSTGGVSINVTKRFYDINVFLSKENITVQNVNFSNLTASNISLNLYKITDVDFSNIIPLYKPLTGIASNSTGLDTRAVNLIFDNYSQYSYNSVSALSIIKCANWNYTSRTCLGSWAAISSSTNVDTKKVSGNSTGFSSYILAESKCGNGLCEVAYGETTSTCSNDCPTTSVSVSTAGGGGGGGGGASVTDIEKLLKNYFNVGGVKVETTSIYKEMFAGETATVRITLSNSLTTPTTVTLGTDGDIKDFIFFESSSFELAAHESKDISIKIVLPREAYPGNYDGDLIVSSGGYDGKIPVTVRILVPEGKLLDIKILPLKATVAPGAVLRLQTDLLNLGQTKRVDVQFDLQLIDVNTGHVITRAEEAFAVETTFSTIKNLTIPKDTPVGKYIVKATAYYSNLEQQYMQASSIAYIFVDYPILQRKFLGIPVWIYLIVALLIGSIDGFILTSNWLKNRKKRFKVSVEFNKLPALSSSSIFIGKVAETAVRTFLDLNKLQMHTLIAGATGSGKTIAAQDVVEGALMHNKSVIIFDPTAQWTGFFRPSDDKGMLKRYQYFDMKVKDAKGFNGTIKTIHDPYEIINLKEYMDRAGEITIFDISNLTPADIDIIVASTTEQIFKSKPDESKELKSLIVYDEVHRLLPKFGGSGRGFVQLERGAREFRKWGIGLLLISQVLSDFVGEIKANIGTEVQMGTRYEGDLERISLKYGEDVLKAVVKEPIGTGMVVNAEYNSGKPYFVSFRPLLHSTKRLSNIDLKKYEAYFDQIEDLDYQIKRLEQYGIDVLDLKLELKITKDKVKSGQFQMVDMYLESLLPVIAGHWKSIGKNPEHIVRERLTKAEVTEGIEKAARERQKYLEEHPQAKLTLAEELSNLRKGIEEKRKTGKNTTDLESKLNDFQNRLKGFKGTVSVKDAEGIMTELNSLKKILGGL